MKRNYDILDITKFVLSLMVIAIHVNPFGLNSDNIRYPFLRIAVPMFFIISSYLLFKRIKETGNDKELVKKFVFRQLKLYFIWFLILLPITLHSRWTTDYFLMIRNIIVDLFFASTFPASWYVMASVIGTIIVYLISKKNNVVLIPIAIICYVLCIFGTLYYYVLPPDSFIIRAVNYFPGYSIGNSFVVSILYITIGKIISEHRIIKDENKIRWDFFTLFVATYVLTSVEYYYIGANYNILRYTCSFFLPITCTFLFVFLLSINIKFKFAKQLRYCSTIFYFAHKSLGDVCLGWLFSKFIINIEAFPYGLIRYIVTVLLLSIGTFIIFKLQKFKKFGFLRNLY